MKSSDGQRSIDREELLQIITDIANRYYLPKTLVKDVRNVVYTNLIMIQMDSKWQVG
jgi:hypothetical protein